MNTANMKRRSSTGVSTATIGLKTKMRQNVIKILSIFAVTRGLALFSPKILVLPFSLPPIYLSTLHLVSQNLHQLQAIHVATVALNLQMSPHPTGRIVPVI